MAGKTIKGITVEIGGNTTQLGNALKKVNTQTASLQRELKGVNSLLKMDPSNVTMVTQKQELLTKAINETKEKLNILKEAEAQVQAQFEKGDITEEQYRDLQREIVATENKLSNLERQQEEYNESLKVTAKEITDTRNSYEKLTDKVNEQEGKLESLKDEYKNVIIEQGENSESAQTLREKIDSLNNELEENQKRLKDVEDASQSYSEKMSDLGNKVENAGGKITEVGKKASIASGVATGALALVSKTAIDFESAWTGVTKTVDGTPEQLEKIKQGILDLSESTSSTAIEIAGVAEAAGQLGVKQENVLAFTETMVRLGDSTDIAADEAATAIAQLYNIMGSDINTVDCFGATIVALGNNSATSESKIMNMATRLAAAGSQVGLTEQQTLALSATLASVGLEAEGGGSAISAVITEVDKCVATNADSLQDWANVAGMSVADFKNLWENDAMSAIQKIVAGMGDAKTSGSNLNVILDELGVTSLRQTDTMKRLSNASELLGDSVELSNLAWDANTALTEESEKRYETTESKITQLKNTITELCVKLGEVLLPIIQSVTDKIKSVVEWFGNLSPVAQKVILVITGIVAAIGPVLIVIGKMVSAVGSIIKILPMVKTAITAVKGAMAALNTTMLANPVFLIIAAIAALIAIFVVLYNKCDWFREAVDKVWAKVKEGFQAVLDWFKELPEKISAFVERVKLFFTETIPNAVKGFIENIKNFFKENWQALLLLIVNPFAGAFKLLYDNCEGFRETINGFVEKIKLFFTETIPNAIQSVIQWFTELPYKIGFAIGLIIGHIAQFALNVWEFFTVKLPEYITIAIEWLKDLPSKIWDAIVSAIDSIGQWCKEMGTKAVIGTALLINNVIEWFKSLPSKIWNAIITAVDKISAWCSQMWNKLSTGIPNLINSVINWFKALPNKISSAISNGVNAISTWCNNMKTKAVSGVKNVANSVIDGFKSLPSKMLDVGKNIVEGIWKGIQNAKNWVVGKVKEFAKGILDGMKSALGIHSPSRVFRDEIGKFISEGIGVGITENENAPIEALESLGNNMLDGAKNINGVTLSRQIENTFQGSVTSDSAVLSYLSEIVTKLDRKRQVVLDTGAYVGETVTAYDEALGMKKLHAERGW